MEYAVVHDEFGRRVAEGLGLEFREFREEFYPDGEPCPRILAEYQELTDRDVLVVARLKSPTTTLGILSYLHDLDRVTFNLTDKLHYNARSVEVVMPYFLLGRQDHNPRTDANEKVRSRDKGRDVGYRNILRNLEARGVRRVLTFSPHFDRYGEGSRVYRELGGGIEVYRIPGINALARYFRGRLSPGTVAINPDMTSGKMAEGFASLVGASFRHGLDKKRVTDREVEFRGTLDVEGRDVVIVDDIVSAGSTILGAVKSLVNVGMMDVAVIHAVLPEMSAPDRGYRLVKKLLAEGRIREFVATDTIDSEFSKASVIGDIVDFYRRHK